MEAVLDARQVLSVLHEHKVPAPPRLASSVAVYDAFGAWRADDPLTPLLDSLSTLDPADVPAALDQVADRLARSAAAKQVLQNAVPAANRQVALALGEHAEEVIVSLRRPYLAAAAKLAKLAEQLPTDDPADAISAGDAAVKALRALPEVVGVLDRIRRARSPLDRRHGVVEVKDPLLIAKVDDDQAAAVRALPDGGPGGMWLPLVRAGFELWFPTVAEAKAHRERQQQQAAAEAERQRLAVATGPGSAAAFMERYGTPAFDTMPPRPAA
jgi:hypothetical protein